MSGYIYFEIQDILLKKILIIENAAACESGTESVLTEAGYKTYTSAGDKDGIEIACHYHPDLIICNAKTHEDGFKTLEFLCSDSSTETIPIIFIADTYDKTKMRKAMELGADDYLTKPLDINSLKRAIQTVFKKREALKQKMILNLSASFGDEENEPVKNDHILIKIGTKLKFIKYTNIVCINALKEYSQVITSDNCKITVRKSLRNWMELLPPKAFLRIHRATIVNMEYVEKIVKTNSRSYEVYLQIIKDPFQLSQRFANIMRKSFPS